MKTKFFLCMRPPVIETDDGDYIKPPPIVASSYTTVSDKTSGRRNKDPRRKKRVAVESTGNISESKYEAPVEKDSVTEPHVLESFYVEESVCLEKLSTTISNNKVSGGPKSNSGAYIMISSLFFTMFFGKVFGILCTLMLLVCSLYPHRKKDVKGIRMPENVVVNWPEEGSPEEYKKRVIMAGLLERKSHYR